MDKYDANSSNPGRRKVLTGLAAAGAALALPFGGTRALAQAKPPFRIGVLNTFSKSAAVLGNGCLAGLNFYFDEIGWQAGTFDYRYTVPGASPGAANVVKKFQGVRVIGQPDSQKSMIGIWDVTLLLEHPTVPSNQNSQVS